MGKFKIGINFDKKFLNALKEDEKSGVTVQKCVRHLSLHPIHLNNVITSIKNLLNDEITKYNKSYGGLVLGYQNIKLPSNIGLINNDSCYIHMNIEADFFIFKPEVGKELQGIVNRKSTDHVGVLVYNAFNVSIPKPENVADDDDEEWLGSSVSVGSEVLFRITNIDLSSCLPHIKGELISIISEFDSGISTGDENKMTTPLNKKIIFDDDVNEIPAKEKIKKKNKSKNLSPENTDKNKKRKIIDDNNIDDNDDSEIYQPKKKKNKHKQGDDIVQVSKKKKKKHNKEENESVSLLPNIKTELESNDQSINTPNKEKKKKSKRKKDMLNGYKGVSVKEEISFEEYNLTELFDESKFDKINDKVHIKKEKLDNKLDSTINEVKKTKKRRHTCSEAESSVKKHKRNSS